MASAVRDADPVGLSAGGAPSAASIPSKPVARRKKVTSSGASARGRASARAGEFTCQVCSAVIKWSSNFSRHMRLHDKGKRQSCPKCRKLFRDTTELRIHLESGAHMAPIKHTCAECGGQFPSQRTLLHHSHDKVRAFPCDICRRRFQTAVVRAAHRRRHFWRGLPRCRVCCATFARVEHLTRHIGNHASETSVPVRY